MKRFLVICLRKNYFLLISIYYSEVLLYTRNFLMYLYTERMCEKFLFFFNITPISERFHFATVLRSRVTVETINDRIEM